MTLTESFIFGTLSSETANNNALPGIHFYEFQPLSAVKATFKKSSVQPNCLAWTETHLFAAQAGKAIVHVYSRLRKNQEAIVPFPEKIRSLAVGAHEDGAGVLILGTEEGGLILWELGTGRQVFVTQHHIQAVTCLGVDSSSNFILSGSSDSNIHLWSLPGLLAFKRPTSEIGQETSDAPIRSLPYHRDEVTSVAFGHIPSDYDIAVSVSKDKTCVIWGFHTGETLKTFLLSKSPLCLTIDPADRAAYIGYEDGSIQLLDFYRDAAVIRTSDDSAQRSMPTQATESDCWIRQGYQSQAHCIQVSFDGTLLLSGHADGKVHLWDIARGVHRKQIVDVGAAVTNLLMLPPSGLSGVVSPGLRTQSIVKPKYQDFSNSGQAGMGIPANYKLNVQFNTPLEGHKTFDSLFKEALTSKSFPQAYYENAQSEFSTLHKGTLRVDTEVSAPQAGQTMELKAQIDKLTSKLRNRDLQERQRQHEAARKVVRKRERRLRSLHDDEVTRKKAMSVSLEPGEMAVSQIDRNGDLSTDTDELSDT